MFLYVVIGLENIKKSFNYKTKKTIFTRP